VQLLAIHLDLLSAERTGLLFRFLLVPLFR